jgi:hypothetical protein
MRKSLLLVALGAVGIANAQIYVYQEATAGVGDFVLQGQVAAYTGGVSTDAHYGWDTVDTSYLGPLSTQDGVSNLYFYDGTDGLSFVVVHDHPDDGSGGEANTQVDVSGDSDGVAWQVQDDPDGQYTDTYSATSTTLVADQDWAVCCTDGYAVGSLDGNQWVLDYQFQNAPGGINDLVAVTNDGSTLQLDLEAGRRVRFTPVPEPATMVAVGAGLLAVLRRRKK